MALNPFLELIVKKALLSSVVAAVALVALVNGCATDETTAAEDLLATSTVNGNGAPGLILTFDDGPRAYSAPVTYTSIIDGLKSTVRVAPPDANFTTLRLYQPCSGSLLRQP